MEQKIGEQELLENESSMKLPKMLLGPDYPLRVHEMLGEKLHLVVHTTFDV